MRAARLNSIVAGDEVLPVEMDGDITGPDDDLAVVQARDSGTQHIVHIGNPNNAKERKAVVAQARAAWRQARKDRGLD